MQCSVAEQLTLFGFHYDLQKFFIHDGRGTCTYSPSGYATAEYIMARQMMCTRHLQSGKSYATVTATTTVTCKIIIKFAQPHTTGILYLHNLSQLQRITHHTAHNAA